ncbi:replication initiator [Nonomuraea cypriaca]|uniref:replication initiator n=1 Tax=Nonomuraea cypriaca TaxID=1187855 RepID=UPI0038B2ABD7
MAGAGGGVAGHGGATDAGEGDRAGAGQAGHPLAHLRLRDWAHMLGFRGHFSTKSRAYSTTLGDLRQARIDWTRARLPYDPETTFVLGHWQYAGQGFTPGEHALAASFAPEVRHD